MVTAQNTCTYFVWYNTVKYNVYSIVDYTSVSRKVISKKANKFILKRSVGCQETTCHFGMCWKKIIIKTKKKNEKSG